MNTLHILNRSGFCFIAALSLVAGLAGCNGGDSYSGGGGVTLPTTPVTITTTNAPAVAGAMIDTVTGTMSLPTGVQTAAPAAPTVITTAKMIARLGASLAQQTGSQGSAPAAVTGAVITINCLVSGTETITDTSATSATATFTNCSDVAGVTISGTLSLSNFTSNAGIDSMDAVYNLTITTTSPPNTATATGDMHIVINTNTFAMTVSGTSLTLANTNAALGNVGMQNYSFSFDSTGTVTAMTFTFASSVIGGTASFTLTSPFGSTSISSLFPSSGAGVITGANSTKLRMTVLGDETAAVNSQVQLELSTDNGATYGTPMLYTWAEISSHL